MPNYPPRTGPTPQDGQHAKLESALAELRGMLDEELFMEETPLEVQAVMERAAAAIEEALESNRPRRVRSPSRSPGSPTPQQGQFLAYIREYMMRNHAEVAPTHADLQRFFVLTPPSVNSMLARLEERGFIRRTPRRPRGITLTIDPALIPELDRPFKG